VSVVNKRTFKRWLLVKFKYDLLKDEPDVIGRYFETASGLGIRDDGRGPTLIATASKRALKGAATKSGFRDPKHIAIAPGARHWNKRWPAEHYRELAIKLIERGYNITFYGSKSEIELIDHIRAGLPAKGHHSLAGELDLAETAHLIGTCGVAITNDSGLLHVAEAVGTPVISMFGPTVRQFGFAPRAANAIVLEVGGLYCRPCTAIGLGYCPEKHFRCMREIGAEVVMEKILYPVRST
jgi:heptosyltransferase-2